MIKKFFNNPFLTGYFVEYNRDPFLLDYDSAAGPYDEKSEAIESIATIAGPWRITLIDVINNKIIMKYIDHGYNRIYKR